MEKNKKEVLILKRKLLVELLEKQLEEQPLGPQKLEQSNSNNKNEILGSDSEFAISSIE